jgi:hypothetical protein
LRTGNIGRQRVLMIFVALMALATINVLGKSSAALGRRHQS